MRFRLPDFSSPISFSWTREFSKQQGKKGKKEKKGEGRKKERKEGRKKKLCFDTKETMEV